MDASLLLPQSTEEEEEVEEEEVACKGSSTPWELWWSNMLTTGAKFSVFGFNDPAGDLSLFRIPAMGSWERRERGQELDWSARSSSSHTLDSRYRSGKVLQFHSAPDSSSPWASLPTQPDSVEGRTVGMAPSADELPESEMEATSRGISPARHTLELSVLSSSLMEHHDGIERAEILVLAFSRA